ncbi:hypothetical protein DL96DRAFT_1608500 [Flagelloscypha sp. PMI_526]|nr:hypothetical protein DL96DRAFT_1608500 [Flagelloscypha sp. PMI_526]
MTKSMQLWNRRVVMIGPDYGRKKNPDGSHCIQLRVCSGYSGHGWYDYLFCDGKWEEDSTCIDAGPEPVFFMDARCWYYLRTWIVLPPLSPIADPEVSFYTEFWELVKDVFDVGSSLSNKLDYSPLCITYDDDQEPPFIGEDGIDYALENACLDGVPHLRQAIRNGLRGDDLSTALLADFQIWAFESPDIWPRWSEAYAKEPIFIDFVASSTTSLCSLPLEILLQIFADATPYDVLNMASTCKSLRHFLVRQDVFPALLREMVLRGSLRWLNPSPFAGDEVARANESLTTWIGNEGVEAESNPFQVPGFPFLAFVHTCFVHSFSMQSRRRIWGIIKQVETLWIDYRNEK